MTLEHLARVCYEANRAYGITLGESALRGWDSLPFWERDHWVNAAWFAVTEPRPTLADIHDFWLVIERQLGWSYGPHLDNASKRHPHHVDWHRLPAEQKAKIALMRAIVETLNTGA